MNIELYYLNLSITAPADNSLFSYGNSSVQLYSFSRIIYLIFCYPVYKFVILSSDFFYSTLSETIQIPLIIY